MSQLVLRNRQRACRVNIPLLRHILRFLLDKLVVVKTYELGVHLVSEPEMVRLNETFMRHAGSTDVITFDHTLTPDVKSLLKNYRKPESPHVGCHERMHGEIFVCMDEAMRQARRFRTSWQSELVRYVVHGALHLCGFDDQRPAARRIMKREENRLLHEVARRWPLAQLTR